MALDNVTFFGPMDRKRKDPRGAITSAYPAWYFDTHLDELKEDIDRKARDLARGVIPPSEVPYAKEELEKQKERYDAILSSRPKLSAKEKDELAKVYKELEQQIVDSMPTYTEMMKGHADPHEEARKMTRPYISVGRHGDLFKKMNIPMDGNKVSRNGATRAYKILGKVLGERTNIETLRRDIAYGRVKLEKSLDELQ